MRKNLVLLLILLFSLFMVACEDDNVNVDSYINVTYDLSYDTENKITTIKYESGHVLGRPSDPIRDNFIFDNWFKLGSNEPFEFNEPVFFDLTLFAKWDHELSISEYGLYTSKDEVALYITTYKTLPSNYMTKEEAGSHISNHWTNSNKASIGGNTFHNYKGILPVKSKRTYIELDIDYKGESSRNALRMVYSNDFRIFYTHDHYDSFVEYDKESRTWVPIRQIEPNEYLFLTLANDGLSANYSDVVKNNSEVILTIESIAGKSVDKLLVNGNDVTSEIINNSYTFNITTDTLVELTYVDIINKLPIDEDGLYISKDDVALYIAVFKKLPSNYMTKEEAGGHISNHWTESNKASIGGNTFTNYQRVLPVKSGRTYIELDIDYQGGSPRNAFRIVYSNDFRIFYTHDHYDTFVEYDKGSRTWIPVRQTEPSNYYLLSLDGDGLSSNYNHFIEANKEVTISIANKQDQIVDKLLVNGNDVTSDITNNKYSFNMTGDTVVKLTYTSNNSNSKESVVVKSLVNDLTEMTDQTTADIFNLDNSLFNVSFVGGGVMLYDNGDFVIYDNGNLSFNISSNYIITNIKISQSSGGLTSLVLDSINYHLTLNELLEINNLKLSTITISNLTDFISEINYLELTYQLRQ